MLADARRCVSERLIKKIKVFLLAILRAEKNCLRLPKRDAEELLEEHRRILNALSWGKALRAIQQRQCLRDLQANLSGLIERARETRKEGEKTSLLASALENPTNLHLALRAMAQISQTLQQHHLQKEKIYKEIQDAEERKQRVKTLRLHERLAKKAYNLWPQTKVTLKHLNFNSQTAKPLMAAMGYRVPGSCNSNNLLWWTDIAISV